MAVETVRFGKTIFFIGFGIQIVLGVVWMCCAFAQMGDLGKGILCVGQIVLLGAAVLFTISGGRKPGRHECLATGAVLTFPMIMQCLTVPDFRVPTAAALLFAMGFLTKGVTDRKACHEENKRIPAACFVVLFLAVGVICMALPEAGTDFGARVGSRVVWTTLYHEFDFLPKEKQDLIDYDVLTESTYEATGLETILIPSMDETLGREKSRELLGEMISLTLEFSRDRVIKEILWDEAGYLMPPLVLPFQLSGRAYESYAGINYRQMLSVAPRLSSMYMYYGCAWFLAAFVLRLLLGFITGFRSGFHLFGRGCAKWILFLYGGVTVILSSAWYTLNSAGRMDYKNALYILCVWLIWIAGMKQEGDRAENCREENCREENCREENCREEDHWENRRAADEKTC